MREVDEERYELYGLEKRVIFRLEFERSTPKSFSACRSREQKEQFAQTLGQQIEQRLHRWFETRTLPETIARDLMRSWADDADVLPQAIEALARETSLRSNIDLKTDIGASAQGNVVLRDRSTAFVCSAGRGVILLVGRDQEPSPDLA